MNRVNSWREELKGSRVAVTGACGTVGGELLRQLASSDVARISVVDHSESGLFDIGQRYRHDERVEARLGDLRDRESLKSALEGCEVVFHSAAYKHVPLCEQSPLQAIQTNIQGTQNVLDVANAVGVRKLIFTSTDKAVNPTNVMGTSKLMAERLVTAANASSSAFSAISTRFGNVLGSSGSVVPLFVNQVLNGGPVTVTDNQMTRFVMALDDAVSLVLESMLIGVGGEVIVTKMPVARVEDIARVCIESVCRIASLDSSQIEIIEVGSRPGEKLYEELINEEEMRRSVDNGDFIVVNPALRHRSLWCTGEPVNNPYRSDIESAMSTSELADYFESIQLIEKLVATRS